MTGNPHFVTVPSWEAARTKLAFRPLEPKYTAGRGLESLSIYVRDHRLRELAVAERTLEAHYGCFVFSQAWKGVEEARRTALAVSYGAAGSAARIAGRAARAYELGPQPPPEDCEGRSPAVVTWHDGGMFYLIASDRMACAELMEIAGSLYE